MAEMVNHPAHYNHGPMECWDALDKIAWSWDFAVPACSAWQVGRYLWRAPHKGNTLQDLNKALRYADRIGVVFPWLYALERPASGTHAILEAFAHQWQSYPLEVQERAQRAAEALAGRQVERMRGELRGLLEAVRHG